MKTGILTYPLNNNYGNLLQAYALMTVLKRMGHDVWLLDIKRSVSWSILTIVKQCIKKYILRKEVFSVIPSKAIRYNELNKIIVDQNSGYFIDKYLCPKISPVYSSDELRYITDKIHFDIFIVGSDQIWRPKFMRRFSMNSFIHQYPEWPNFVWDVEVILPILANVRYLQGKLIGQASALGFDWGQTAFLETLVLDVTKTSAIENEIFDVKQVRSSVARRLGLESAGNIIDRKIDGVVKMLLEATQQNGTSLSGDRLFAWHSAIFPTGYSGVNSIIVGDWRKTGMSVVSGVIGNEITHFQAPDAEKVPFEMQKFITWFNDTDNLDLILKALIAHLWFVTIHPFEDGNGRIGRALMDMLLARSDGTSRRFYSMSSQIQLEREDYYLILEETQKGDLNITNWIKWGLECLSRALITSENTLEKVISKAHFWQINGGIIFNERQKIMLNKLIDGFYGKLTTSKWAKITKCSNDTALRDIQDLLIKNILIKNDTAGRATSYELVTRE